MSTRNPRLNILPQSILSTINNPDYSPWQRKMKAGKQTTLSLPHIVTSNQGIEKKKTSGRQMSKHKRPAGGRGPSFIKQKPGRTQTATMEMEMAQSLEKIKILQRLCWSKTFSLETLKRHSAFLLEKNKVLVGRIEKMDEDTFKEARDLIQLYQAFMTIITTLQEYNQSQDGVAKTEDHLATEETVGKTPENLNLDLKHMQNKVQALQEGLNVLSAYMGKEYPVKGVQIGSLVRSIKNLSATYQSIIAAIQDPNQGQAGVAKTEVFLATEEIMDKKSEKLKQELKQMENKVQAFQEELNYLSTYMDKEYPVKVVQIGSLMRSIRNLSEQHQDELEYVEDIGRCFLDITATRAREEQESIMLAAGMEKLKPYQDGLQQMNWNNLELRRQIETQKEVIDESSKKIHELQKSIGELRQSSGDRRDVIFADILLRRPICTPDMDVVLNIPTDEAEFL